MSVSLHCLPPSSSLPPLRSLHSASEERIVSALHNLRALYCPLRLHFTPTLQSKSGTSTPAQVDSGYVSEDEDEIVDQDGACGPDEVLATLRADEFERSFAVRWLTNLISRGAELPLECEDQRDGIVEEAASILSSFSDVAGDEAEESLVRDFSFPTRSGASVHVRLNDAPLSGTDHTDVGLQSWGASIVLSGLLCASPERFGLDRLPAEASIVELGAGTGLVGLTIAKMLPLVSASASIAATDYHAAVLENLGKNIAANFSDRSMGAPVDTALLDWRCPPASLASTVDFVVAADVVYAPEHAVWLRDCVAQVLKPDGVFWLVVTVRKVGKFEGIPDTAEAAFCTSPGAERDGRVLRILEKTMLEKQRGIGRGDETGYLMFKIGWQAVGGA